MLPEAPILPDLPGSSGISGHIRAADRTRTIRERGACCRSCQCGPGAAGWPDGHDPIPGRSGVPGDHKPIAAPIVRRRPGRAFAELMRPDLTRPEPAAGMPR
jgi:hypothetical protein